MDNPFGYVCPSCGRDDQIFVKFSGVAHITFDGTYDAGDREWDAESLAWCEACDWMGVVRQMCPAAE